MRKGLGAALVVAVVWMGWAASAGAQAPRVAVTVASDGTVPPALITVDQVKHWTDVARRSAGGGSPGSVRELHVQAIQLLISFAWIAGEAREQGVTVTDEQVTKSFQEQKRQSFPKDADYRAFIRQSGQTEADIMQRVRLDMLSRGIRDKVIAQAKITGDQVTTYIQEHPLKVPAGRSLRVVLTKSNAEAEAARQALQRGATWKAIALRYSIDPSTNHRGGRLGYQVKGTLSAPLDRAVFKATPHRLEGPVRTRYGYYVFMVVGVGKPATHHVSRSVARQVLLGQSQEDLLGAFAKAFTAKWTARTTCAPAYAFAQECANHK